jgi:hypothetical protein
VGITPSAVKSQLADNATGLRLRVRAISKDLLTAPQYVHNQGFRYPGRVLCANPALKLAFEGFCSPVPNGDNIPVVLDWSLLEDAFSVDPGPSIVQIDLLAAAVLGAGLAGVLQQAPALSAVALRSFPARSGVNEFLWTREEGLAKLQNQNEFTPTLVVKNSLTPANRVQSART